MSGKGAHEGRPYVRLGGGRGWVPRAGLLGKNRWVPASVFTGVGCTREQRRLGGKAKGEGRKMGSCPRLHEGRLYAGMTEGGKARAEGRKMGPRIREDNGRGAGMVRV